MRKVPRIFSEEELRAFFAAAEQRVKAAKSEKKLFITTRDIAILRLLYSAGLRTIELTTLNVESLNLEKQELTLRFSKGGGSGELQPFYNKETIEWLEKYLSLRENIPHKANGLFLSVRGNRLNTREIRRIFEVVKKKAGLNSGLHCHSLRHTAATKLLKSCNNLEVVRRFLRHVNIATSTIYLHLVKSDIQEALEKARL